MLALKVLSSSINSQLWIMSVNNLKVTVSYEKHTIMILCRSFCSLRNSSTVNSSTFFFRAMKWQDDAWDLCSSLETRDWWRSSHFISEEKLCASVHKNTYCICWHVTKMSYTGSSSGSQPSSSLRQKKHMAMSGLFSEGVWTKPALAIWRKTDQ